ncbi:Bile acid:sodium symporter [Bowdeniella nasicola]|uniref:Bile acid:sodium symporter n=1 Tax=Bowdeniella nasicola TaxID=208480 RepID=A0A1Q5Q5C9_9ACTO|nr:bile acid:sodium symporter family protein [Bowdeniella nasicola]OKL54993.1 Bile acid:sodium symporter [Bowdeniella nasicola]
MSTSTSHSSSTAPAGSDAATEHNAKLAVSVFPVLVILGAVVAYLAPGSIAPALGPWVTTMLGVIMFAMGLTLTPPDFVLVAKRPVPVLLGVVAQYVIMPLAGWAIATVLALPPELAVGVILVGCAPGGTSSNVVTYLAKGDVALSVTMTSISTLLAPIFTPLLALWLAGQRMDVSGSAMALSIVKVVLIPVIAGLVLRLLIPRVVAAVLPALPWLSVAGITGVVMAVVAGSADKIAAAAGIIMLAVVLHNALGYGLGYGLAKVTCQREAACRATAVEVGMQNSGLAATLAATFISPLAALPAAIFSVWHNLSGALLAAILRARPITDEK